MKTLMFLIVLTIVGCSTTIYSTIENDVNAQTETRTKRSCSGLRIKTEAVEHCEWRF